MVYANGKSSKRFSSFTNKEQKMRLSSIMQSRKGNSLLLSHLAPSQYHGGKVEAKMVAAVTIRKTPTEENSL
jgi:hypothetical protein